MQITLPYNDLETIEDEYGRRYITPTGNKYPSVTTFLGKTDSKEHLEEWKNRVGPLYAERYTQEAAARGSVLHDMAEQYLLGNDPYHLCRNNEDKLLFDNFKFLLDKISNVQLLEAALYSDVLKLAGRVDCIGYYNGVLSIIDFKNSFKLKKEEYITNYFLQCTLYSLMVEELTGIKIPQIVILVAVDDVRNQVFVKQRKDYLQTLKDKLVLFRRQLAT